MSERSYTDPALYFALPVWLCAAIVFPLQIGITGASALSLIAYLAAAGVLLSLADALHDLDSYRNWQVAVFECFLRMLGLALPAALAYTWGLLVAPSDAAFEQVSCGSREFSAALDYAAAADRAPAGGDCSQLDSKHQHA